MKRETPKLSSSLLIDLLMAGGLTDVKLLGGLGDVSGLCHFVENLILRKVLFHICLFSWYPFRLALCPVRRALVRPRPAGLPDRSSSGFGYKRF